MSYSIRTVTHPTLTPARQAGTQFIYPRGTEGWVDLGDQLHPRCFTHPPTVTHPSTTNPAVHGCESYSQSVDHKSDALTTTPPSHH